MGQGTARGRAIPVGPRVRKGQVHPEAANARSRTKSVLTRFLALHNCTVYVLIMMPICRAAHSGVQGFAARWRIDHHLLHRRYGGSITMTVQEFQARKTERIAIALAHFVDSTPADKLDWCPATGDESCTRSVLGVVAE